MWSILARNPFSDAVFVFDGIEWLRWVVASIFFLLGIFAGWWTWRHSSAEGEVKEPSPKKPKAEVKPKLKLAAVGETPDESLESGTVPSEFGPVYEKQPEDKDDLQQMKGIGKPMRAKLYGLGIFKFEQIANWGEGEIAAISKKLHLGKQIETDAWVTQAEELAAKD